ncbi:peptidoglycan editing factor PgeF [Leptolyngbya sp. AN02str]|uniref:peptidoglycan editing factor PgeF n=1 Tax=Leptolyngbya sp. AN02str TaxID=3423363 RepID=UPI003D3166B8
MSLHPTWQWQSWEELPYLTCSLLQEFPHGFFTQQCSPRLPEDLTHALHPEAAVYRVKQVHGNRVLSPDEIEGHAAIAKPDESLPSADGVVVHQPAQAAWVCSADCVPALIADVRTGQVAAVHAGWRGTAAKIVPEAIARLQQSGSCLSDLRVALGPAIAGEVYQVSTTVAAEVGASVVKSVATSAGNGLRDRPELDVAAILNELRQFPQPPILPDEQPGRVRLDVRQINLLQLMRLGFTEAQVAIAPYCTYQTPEHFYSYRRNPQKKVQWSGIVSLAA